MEKFGINIEFGQIQELQDALSKFSHIDRNVLPATSSAFAASGELTRKYLANYFIGGSLDGVRELTDKEISTLKNTKVESNQTGDFHAVVSTTNNKPDRLQNGLPDVDYDMKKTHPYGLKSRVSNKGIPYLIIPFRWGTPNGKGTKRRWSSFIPQKEYDSIVKGFELSTVKERDINNLRFEKNAKGQMVERARYKWKSRLKESDSWDDRATGMVRMKDIRGSTYFTFRIISAKSPEGSWLYHRDGTEGINILAALERTVRPKVEKIIETALKTDLNIE